MSGLQQASQLLVCFAISLESMKFSRASRAGTVVANPLLRKAMVAGCILEAEGQGP
jgi:hypothetical protein